MRHDLAQRRPGLRGAVLAPVLLAAVLLVGVAAAGSASSARNGKLAFSVGSPLSIWVMNGDGSRPKVLTPHYRYGVVDRQDSEPDWSPNGTEIAFTRSRQTTGLHGAPSPSTEIDVMNANGSNPTRLTRTPLNDHSPSWSPDGKKIAFVRDRILAKEPGATPFPYGEIWVMNANGSGQTRIAAIRLDVCNKSTLTGQGDNLDATQPAWSPDGTKIAYTSRDPDYPCSKEIYVMNADGSGQRELTGASDDSIGFYPAWSPDGSKIAYQGAPPSSANQESDEVWVMNPDGSGKRQLTRNDNFCPYKCPNHESHGQPAWSPDGSKIALIREIPSKTIDQEHLFDVFVINADGSGLKLVHRRIVDRVDWGPVPSGHANPLPRPPLRPLGHPHLTLSCSGGALYALVAPPAGIDFVQFFLNGIDMQGGNPHFFNSAPFRTSYDGSHLHAAVWTMKAIVSVETESSTTNVVLKKRHAPHC
jgi:dipeptidyl aminopeptidase/acylaminoacyl peptidase